MSKSNSESQASIDSKNVDEQAELDANRSDAERESFVARSVRNIMRFPKRGRSGSVSRHELETWLENSHSYTTLNSLDAVLRRCLVSRALNCTNGGYWVVLVVLMFLGCSSTTVTESDSEPAGIAGAIAFTVRSVQASGGSPAAETVASEAAGASLAGSAELPSVGAAGSPAVNIAGAPNVLLTGAAGSAGAPGSSEFAGSGNLPLTGAAGSAGASVAPKVCPYCDDVTCGGCAWKRPNGVRYVVCDVVISC